MSDPDQPLLTRLDVRGQTSLELPRPERGTTDEVRDTVREIVAAVRRRGDAALVEYTQRFDGVALDSVRVPPDEVTAALAAQPEELRDALGAAAEQVTWFHETQRRDRHTVSRNGVSIEGWHQPVDRAGCYVPGGRAVYPSTVLMTAIPARVAGVPQVALCVPPDSSGSVPAVTLAAAAAAGVDEVYRVGGAQAIAALAYGTESVDPVDVIVGPGNLYVAMAKQLVAGQVGVPSAFAGPSEVVVVADRDADPRLVAIDLMVQAEHGPDGLAWLVSWDPEVADRVDRALVEAIAEAPRSDDIRATMAASGYSVVCDGTSQAAAVANEIAPEHLQLMVADPDAVLSGVRHAGAIFVGDTAPAAAGDYFAGPSHVLPTHRTARYSGALGVDDFCKPMHVISIDADAVATMAPHIEALATAEGLAAHALSLRARRER
jgi:histidinol dehydrogenase